LTQGRYGNLIDVANAKLFRDGIKAIEGRSAPEAAFVVMSGEWGLGKTHLGLNYAVQNDVPFVRLQPACTPHWVLTDWVSELGEQPAHRTEGLFEQLIGILAKRPRAVIFDEVEHALANGKVIDQIRGVVDAVEIPCVLLGREFIVQKLKRHPAVWSRVSSVVKFRRMKEDDMAKLLAARAGCKVDPELMDRLLKDTEGRMRLAMGAADELKRIAVRSQSKILTAADVAARQLVKAEARPGATTAPGGEEG
jgi:hypothetical protein